MNIDRPRTPRRGGSLGQVHEQPRPIPFMGIGLGLGAGDIKVTAAKAS
jgi:hypothetical protein